MGKLLIATVLFFTMTYPVMAETIHVGVDGMVCSFCAKGIENSFKKQDAVKDIKVGLDEKLVTITTKEGKTMDDATIKQIITEAGYNTTTIHHQK